MRTTDAPVIYNSSTGRYEAVTILLYAMKAFVYYFPLYIWTILKAFIPTETAFYTRDL